MTGWVLSLMAMMVAAEGDEVSTYDTWGGWDRGGQALIGYSYRYGDAELIRVNVETGATEQLTDNEANDWFPETTPDGRFVVFVSDRDFEPFGGADIFVLDRETGDERRLTDDGAMKLGLSVSPDGQSVIYPITDENGAGDIWRISLEGGEPENLTATEDLDERNPAFGPTGEQVWMAVGPAGESRATAPSHLETLDLASGERRVRLDLGGQTLGPRVNSAGEVLLTYRDPSENRNLARFDPRTGEVVILTRNDASDHAGFWSPDGTQISFSTYRWGDSELYVMNRDGHHMRNLTRTTVDHD